MHELLGNSPSEEGAETDSDKCNMAPLRVSGFMVYPSLIPPEASGFRGLVWVRIGCSDACISILQPSSV